VNVSGISPKKSSFSAARVLTAPRKGRPPMAATNLIVKRLAVILHDREADAVSTPPERSDRDSAPSGKLDAVNSQLQSVRKVRSSERARAKVELAGGTT